MSILGPPVFHLSIPRHVHPGRQTRSAARSLAWSCCGRSPASGLSRAQKGAVGKHGAAGSLCPWPRPHAEEAPEQMGSPEVGG